MSQSKADSVSACNSFSGAENSCMPAKSIVGV
jgi:hypothetical protein